MQATATTSCRACHRGCGSIRTVSKSEASSPPRSVQDEDDVLVVVGHHQAGAVGREGDAARRVEGAGAAGAHAAAAVPAHGLELAGARVVAADGAVAHVGDVDAAGAVA